MKIGMIGAWNTDSGASIHAELLGRAWKDMGVDLQVFTFYRHSYHGTALTKDARDEEDFVHRCFTVYGDPHPLMDTAPLLENDYDIFVAEDLGMLPLPQLLSIFPEIRKKAKTVNVVHDGSLSTKPEYFRFDWDHAVCFDDRYYNFLKAAYPEGKLSIIPYPSYPLKVGDKDEARKKLGLPLGRNIVLMFGQAAEHALNATMVLDRLVDDYDPLLLIVTEVERVLEQYNNIIDKSKVEIKIVEESPDLDLLYDYLHAADCMIYNKPNMPVVVVGSTVFQCMGSGCPTIALESDFVYSFDREVIKYRNFYQLENILVDVFTKGKKYQAQQRAIVDYLDDKAAEPTAKKFLELFEILLKKKKG